MSMENSIRVVQEWYKETSKTALQDALAEERYQGEKQNKLETAKEMLKDNMAIDTIIKYTKLPKSEILALRS